MKYKNTDKVINMRNIYKVANRLTAGRLVRGLAGQQFLHRAADCA